MFSVQIYITAEVILMFLRQSRVDFSSVTFVKQGLCHILIFSVNDQSLFGSFFEVPLRFGLVDNTVLTVILHGAFLAVKTQVQQALSKAPFQEKVQIILSCRVPFQWTTSDKVRWPGFKLYRLLKMWHMIPLARLTFCPLSA